MKDQKKIWIVSWKTDAWSYRRYFLSEEGADKFQTKLAEAKDLIGYGSCNDIKKEWDNLCD